MRDESVPARKTSGGLASCESCLDVVPAARLVSVDSQLVCGDCNRRLTAKPGAEGAMGTPGARDGLSGDGPSLVVPRDVVPTPRADPSFGPFASAPLSTQRSQPGETRFVGRAQRVLRPRAVDSAPANPTPLVDTSASPDRDGPAIRTTHRPPFERSPSPTEPPVAAAAASPSAAPRAAPGRFGGGFGAGNGLFMDPTSLGATPPAGPARLGPASGAAPPVSSKPVSTRPGGGASPPPPWAVDADDDPQPTTPPARRCIPGFPHLDERPAGSQSVSTSPAATRPPSRSPDSVAGWSVAPVSAAGATPAGRTPGDDGKRSASTDGFAEYADLRMLIDQGQDTLEVRRRAAEIASRLSLQIEAIEHYRRCTELAPGDDKLRTAYENVRRTAPAGRGGLPETPTEPARRVPEEAAPFWTDLGDVLAYPLAGRGASVLVAGGVFFAIADVLRTVNPFGWALTIMIVGYCTCYLFDVINATGAGKRALPQMPEFTSFLETYVSPVWSLFVCGAISFAPFCVAAWLAIGGTLPSPIGGVLCLITFLWGAFAMPMTLMIRAMFQNWSEPLNPGLVLGSIGRIFPDYLAAYIAMSILWVGYAFASAVIFGVCWLTLGLPTADAILAFDLPRIASWILCTFLSWPLFLYAWTLHGHILGRTYSQGLRRLQWFVQATPESRVARRTSAALVVGAVAATGLLCGAAWGVTKAVTTMAGGSAGSLLKKSPVKDGSRLTYFWQHTDGGAGLTTYCFDALPDGNLRVSAVVRLANRPDYCAAREDLGVMDPATGLFISVGHAWGPGVNHEGRRGEHVAFFGPTKASVGSTYLNEWPVRGSERWRDAWHAWRVQYTDPVRPSADLYFDTRSGVLVGRKYGGVGYLVTEWLVAAKDVKGVTAGPPPAYDFGSKPYDWTGDGATDGATDGAEMPGGHDSFEDAILENR